MASKPEVTILLVLTSGWFVTRAELFIFFPVLRLAVFANSIEKLACQVASTNACDAPAVYTGPDDNLKYWVQQTSYATRPADWRGGCCAMRAGSDTRICRCCATCNACQF